MATTRHGLNWRLASVLAMLTLVVLSFALMIGPLMQARASTKKRECVHNLKQISIAINTYRTRYGESVGWLGNASFDVWKALLQDGLITKKMLVCPLTGTLPGQGRVDYRHPKDASVFHNAFEAWSGVDTVSPIIADEENNHRDTKKHDINVLVQSGAVLSVTDSDILWEKCRELLSSARE